MNFSSIQSVSAISPNNVTERLASIQGKPSESLSTSNSSEISFGGLIQDFLQQANSAQRTADQSIEAFVTGKTDNIQDVAIAMANAEISIQYFLEVRNKVIESFNDLMRMPF